VHIRPKVTDTNPPRAVIRLATQLSHSGFTTRCPKADVERINLDGVSWPKAE
jgi:hypothetical protein